MYPEFQIDTRPANTPHHSHTLSQQKNKNATMLNTEKDIIFSRIRVKTMEQRNNNKLCKCNCETEEEEEVNEENK